MKFEIRIGIIFILYVIILFIVMIEYYYFIFLLFIVIYFDDIFCFFRLFFYFMFRSDCLRSILILCGFITNLIRNMFVFCRIF